MVCCVCDGVEYLVLSVYHSNVCLHHPPAARPTGEVVSDDELGSAPTATTATEQHHSAHHLRAAHQQYVLDDHAADGHARKNKAPPSTQSFIHLRYLCATH